jgi:hypothetical protein
MCVSGVVSIMVEEEMCTTKHDMVCQSVTTKHLKDRIDAHIHENRQFMLYEVFLVPQSVFYEIVIVQL